MYFSILYKKIFIVCLLLLLIKNGSSQNYTAGNIVVLEIGTGAAGNPNLGGQAYQEVLIEYKPSGGAAITATVTPSTTAGARCTDGTQASDGDLNLSGDGRYLTFTGYDIAALSPLSVATANVNRMIAMVNNSRTVTFPAYYSSVSPNGCYQTNNIRAAVTNDGTSFWTAGSGTNGGCNNIPNGLAAGTMVNGVASVNSTSTRTVKIFNNQLYGNANSGYFNPFTIGSGMPTTGPQLYTILGATGSTNGYSFVLFDRNRDGNPDLLYVADANGGNAGLYKYYLNGATWTYAGRLLTGTSLFGVTGYLDCSNNPVLFMTTLENVTNGSGAVNKIYKYTDASAVNSSNFSGAASVLESAASGYIYKGIAMAPTQGDLTVSASTTAAGNYRKIIVTTGTTLTLTANTNVSDSIYVANGATLDCGTFTVGGRSFVLDAGATLKIGDPNGITASAALGNIQTSCRNYNSLATYVYEGAAAQVTGDGLPYTILNLTIDNTSTGVTLTDSVYITNLLSLTTGVLYSTSATLLIIGPSPGNAAGGSNASYVDGPMKKIGNSAFTFRTGNNGYYAAIAMSAPALVTDNFIAQYVNTSPNPTYNIFSVAPTIDHVSNCEYWYLYNTGGVSNVSVTLTWNTPRSCGVNVLTDLIVAQWDGSMWQDFGRQATIGNTVAGAIFSSIQPTVYSDTMPFTLGSISYQNPLPIELLTFDAAANGADVDINWSTATEKNNDYFNVERSADAATFTSIAKVNGAGNSVNTINYADIDHQPLAGTSYYRLKQTDFDGNTTYSEIKSVTINKPFSVNGIYPNPTEDNFNIAFNENPKEQLTLKLYNSLGEEVYSKTGYFSQLTKIDIANLPSSIYFIEINGDTFSYRNTIIKK